MGSPILEAYELPECGHGIAEPLIGLAAPITDVQPHPANPRIGNVVKIAESLAKHGQFKAIVVQDSTGFICAGNHTWKAAKLLGWTHAAFARLDISDEDAKRILAVDNRTGDLGEYDDRLLAELLQELAESDDGLAGSGYEAEDLEDLVALLETADFERIKKDVGDHEESDLWPVISIRVPPDMRDAFLELTHSAADDGDLGRFRELLRLAGWDG